jgi:hypothetical protein
MGPYEIKPELKKLVTQSPENVMFSFYFLTLSCQTDFVPSVHLMISKKRGQIFQPYHLYSLFMIISQCWLIEEAAYRKVFL